MQIQSISFKNNLISQFEQKKVDSNLAVELQRAPDKVEFSNKKKDIIKYSAIGVGIFAAILAIVKHKQIGKFFSKVFKKCDLEPKQNVKAEELPINHPPISNIDFPEPKFTCGEENLEQFAKEKKEYVGSIINYVHHTDNRLVVKTLEAVEKYGSGIKDVERIAGTAGEPSENQDVIRAFVRAIAANGDNHCSKFVSDFIARTDGNIHEYEPETIITIMKSMSKIGNLEEIEHVQPYLNHESEAVREASLDTIDNINKNNFTRPAY